MNKLFLLCVCLMLLLGYAGGEREEDTSDGNFLMVSCQIVVRSLDNPQLKEDVYDAWRDGLCGGLVQGVGDSSPVVCAKDPTIGQEVRVVVKYLQDHPEKLHLRNTFLIREALSQAFPCKE